VFQFARLLLVEVDVLSFFVSAPGLFTAFIHTAAPLGVQPFTTRIRACSSGEMIPALKPSFA
jgi:hypothetical protein